MNQDNQPRSDNLEAEKPQAPAEQRKMQHPPDKIGFQGTDQSSEKKQPAEAVAANDPGDGAAASPATAQQPGKAVPQEIPQKRS